MAALMGANLRRNFALLIGDYGMFGVGMAIASTSTVVPAFAEHLGASNLLIGAIPSITILGYTLPPLFYANYTERQPHKLRFILRYTIWERLPHLFMAAAALFLAERWPGFALLIVLLGLATMSGVGGALMPAWMDLIAKVIPANYRGRLFAYSSTVGAGLGLGGAALTGYYLQAYAYPLNYALIFATAFVFLMLSLLALALVVEPELASNKPHVSTVAYLRCLPEILVRDRNFSWYLVSRAVGSFASMANGFYTVFALRVLQAPEWQVSRFTLVLLAGQTLASLVFGYISDRIGHKPVLVAGTTAVIVGNLAALVSTHTGHIYLAFVFMAVATAAGTISSLNLVMEFAPEADRPTYIGLATTLTAPVGFLASLVGGLLADSVGYRAVFAVAGTAAAASVLVLATKVRDARAIGSRDGGLEA
ncbi:MAG: MFS transporter [Anaerolineae bacterium]